VRDHVNITYIVVIEGKLHLNGGVIKYWEKGTAHKQPLPGTSAVGLILKGSCGFVGLIFGGLFVDPYPTNYFIMEADLFR